MVVCILVQSPGSSSPPHHPHMWQRKNINPAQLAIQQKQQQPQLCSAVQPECGDSSSYIRRRGALLGNIRAGLVTGCGLGARPPSLAAPGLPSSLWHVPKRHPRAENTCTIIAKCITMCTHLCNSVGTYASRLQSDTHDLELPPAGDPQDG